VKKKDAIARTRSNPGPLVVHKARPRTARQGRFNTSHRPALHVLLSKTIEFLLSTGESPQHVALELEGQAQRVKGRLRLWRTKDARRVQHGRERVIAVAGVVHDWHREPAYTNRNGEPLQLTQKSLSTLIGKRFARPKIPATVSWMLENGLIRKTNRGKIALIGGRQVVPKGAVALDRAAGLIPQYLRVVLHNARTKNPYSRDIDREARVFALPEKYVPLWRAVARERTQVFLEGVDNWLEDHTRRDDLGPVCEVGIHCFGYTGDSGSLKTARHPRRLKARGG
jgi:hypothetical protein